MRDADAVTTRLSEYAPPDYLIDEIALVVSLDPDATLVAARSQVRRTAADPRPFALDGERLDLQSVAIDGQPLDTTRYRIETGKLIIDNPP